VVALNTVVSFTYVSLSLSLFLFARRAKAPLFFEWKMEFFARGRASAD